MCISCILLPALLLLIGLISAEKSGSHKMILLFKTPLSMLFIVAWSLRPAQYPLFSHFILTALLFCLAGDILLAFGSQKTFLAGLVSFLLGHVGYATAFFIVSDVGPTMATGVILLMAAAALVWRWLSPHLGTMRNPVVAYIVVISTMVAGALGVYSNSSIPEGVRTSILAGAVLFYLSDLFVARERFIVSEHVNRLVGLPLYYSAQFILAFSAAYLP
jgi:uncharacterized membrane protein YhhN